MSSNQPNLWESNIESSWMEFREARAFARSLEISTNSDWNNYTKGRLSHLAPLPENIPIEPDRIYRLLGWKSWDDWFGIAPDSEKSHSIPPNLWETEDSDSWMEFEDARRLVHQFDLEYKEDWDGLKNGVILRPTDLPNTIPPNPEIVYKHKGWRGWKDWLISKDRLIEYSTYTDAKRFVWCLRLIAKNDWFEYMRQEIPAHSHYHLNVPKRPNLEYIDCGWVSWDDWLGIKHEFVEFDFALKFVRKLKLLSIQDWRDYCKGNHLKHQKRSEKIPCYPDQAYKRTGWIDWDKWLGISDHGIVDNKSDLQTDTLECKCKGKIKDCLVCDGKGYVTIQNL